MHSRSLGTIGEGGLPCHIKVSRIWRRLLRIGLNTTSLRVIECTEAGRTEMPKPAETRPRHLLERGNISIGEAAYEVGFADQSHLTRHFRRVFGLTPKAFLYRQESNSGFNSVPVREIVKLK
jgi:hypothetical protein